MLPTDIPYIPVSCKKQRTRKDFQWPESVI